MPDAKDWYFCSFVPSLSLRVVKVSKEISDELLQANREGITWPVYRDSDRGVYRPTPVQALEAAGSYLSELQKQAEARLRWVLALQRELKQLSAGVPSK